MGIWRGHSRSASWRWCRPSPARNRHAVVDLQHLCAATEISCVGRLLAHTSQSILLDFCVSIRVLMQCGRVCTSARAGKATHRDMAASRCPACLIDRPSSDVCVCVCARARARVCVCARARVCVRARAHVCVPFCLCVYVCVSASVSVSELPLSCHV